LTGFRQEFILAKAGTWINSGRNDNLNCHSCAYRSLCSYYIRTRFGARQTVTPKESDEPEELAETWITQSFSDLLSS
jgi:hypothetical protein